jgi:hypothetical protein
MPTRWIGATWPSWILLSALDVKKVAWARSSSFEALSTRSQENEIARGVGSPVDQTELVRKWKV